MKILQITGEYPPFVLGGLGTYVEEITKRLAKRHHQIKVCVLKGESRSYNLVKDSATKGIEVIQKEFDPEVFSHLTSHINDSNNLVSKFELGEFISDPPDIIHVHDWYGTLWGASIKAQTAIPLIMTSHLPIRAGFTYTGHPISIKLKVKLEALGIRLSNKILAPSQFVANVLIDEYNANRSSVVVIPNGVDFSFFKPKSKKKKKNITQINLLAVSRLTEQKGLTYLLDVVYRLKQTHPSVHCTIVGTGPLLDQLQSECQRLKLTDNIDFAGFLQKKELREVYHNSTFFLSTSIYEPFGLVILEAMASGLPVISFDVGGIQGIINDKVDGILIPPGDTDAMAKSIMSCLEKPHVMKEISHNGLSKAKTYDWETITSSLELLYQSVISDGLFD